MAGNTLLMTMANPQRCNKRKAIYHAKPCSFSAPFFTCRVNVHNLAQAANWRSVVKTSLELQTCPLFLKLLYLTKGNRPRGVWSRGARLQLQRRFYQTAPICNLRHIVRIYPSAPFFTCRMWQARVSATCNKHVFYNLFVFCLTGSHSMLLSEPDRQTGKRGSSLSSLNATA
jgi:hypothetical protein